MRDVCVVGAGHNALVAACYLARAGLDVEVVERAAVPGGAAATTELFPGYRVDRGASLHILVRHTGIVEDLALTRFGLRYLDADPWGFAPAPDGPGILFSTDLAATCASIEARCGSADAAAYESFMTEWSRRGSTLLDAFHSPPAAATLGRALWRLGRRTPARGPQLARDFLSPADALLDRHFADERLKAALAWLAAQSGPPAHAPATAAGLAWVALMHRRPPGRAVGGSGALTDALAARLRSDGGTLRLADPAVAIDMRAGLGEVRTAAGDRVAARTVLAGCHVVETLRLLGRADLAAEVRTGAGMGMAVRLATRALPGYPGAPPGAHHGMQLLPASRALLAGAYADALSGRPPRHPACLVLTPSALDPTLAPPGRHTVTIWAQWHPYAPKAGWPGLSRGAAEACVAEVDAAAPGFADSVLDLAAQTPLDLERELGLVHGNLMHVEMELDSMFALRPLPGWSGYRTPYPGLYLTGASTHPGGGVSGASGRSAARVLLADLRPTRFTAAVRLARGKAWSTR